MFDLLLYIPVNSYGPVVIFSLPNHTFFLGKLEQAVNQYFVYVISLVNDNNSTWIKNMTVEIISWSISMKVWDQARIKLTTSGSVVKYTCGIF